MKTRATVSGEVNTTLLIVAAVVVIGVAVGGYFLFQSLMSQKAPPPKKDFIQEIEFVAPPPPPPPPPPPEVEEEPEPEEPEPEPEEPEPEPEPEPEADSADDSTDEALDNLEMDGPAGDGDGFGIKKGKPKCTIGCGKGKGGSKSFERKLKQGINQILEENEALRKLTYQVVVKLWLDPAGRIERTELVGSTGNSETDQALQLALAPGKSTGVFPGDDLPQPIKMKINSRL